MKLFTIFTTLVFLFSGAQSQGQTNCRFIADIVFILDESGSVGATNFGLVKNFVNSIIGALDVDDAKEKVRVGVVTFAGGSSVEIALGAYTNQANLISQVSAIPFASGGTNVLAGLNTGLAVMAQGLTGAPAPGIGNTRPGVPDNQVPRIFFIFGDGDTVNRSASITLAAAIRGGTSSVPYPINIFTVFIGSSTSSGAQFFRDISSTPLSMWNVGINDFNSINTGALVQQFCDTGGMMFGDVHFTTHDGVMYTFNGAGDYIYMKTEDKVDIHVRDIYVGRATAVAAVALADKKSGSVLEIWWDGEGSERLLVNVRHKNSNGNKVVPILREKQLHHPFHVQQIDIGLVQIKHAVYHDFSMLAHYGGRASFQPRVPKSWKTSGLGGNNNDLVEDDICNRSGKCLSLNATNEEIHKIGLDWAVLPSELLFEKWMPVQDWEIRYHSLKINPEQLLSARNLCGEVQPCIYDYISTGSETYAKHTKNDYYSHILNEGKLVYVGDRY